VDLLILAENQAVIKTDILENTKEKVCTLEPALKKSVEHLGSLLADFDRFSLKDLKQELLQLHEALIYSLGQLEQESSKKQLDYTKINLFDIMRYGMNKVKPFENDLDISINFGNLKSVEFYADETLLRKAIAYLFEIIKAGKLQGIAFVQENKRGKMEITVGFENRELLEIFEQYEKKESFRLDTANLLLYWEMASGLLQRNNIYLGMHADLELHSLRIDFAIPKSF
jgi:hypothetical protein